MKFNEFYILESDLDYTQEMEEWFNERTNRHIELVQKYAKLIEDRHQLFPPLYHGTSSDELIKTLKFNTKDVYLTDVEEEAAAFAYGVHLGGAHGETKYILTIDANDGKVYDGDREVQQIVMEEHPKYKDLDELMDWARTQNYQYVTFKHPSTVGDEDILVVVSLYPNKDLNIINIEKV